MWTTTSPAPRPWQPQLLTKRERTRVEKFPTPTEACPPELLAEPLKNWPPEPIEERHASEPTGVAENRVLKPIGVAQSAPEPMGVAQSAPEPMGAGENLAPRPMGVVENLAPEPMGVAENPAQEPMGVAERLAWNPCTASRSSRWRRGSASARSESFGETKFPSLEYPVICYGASESLCNLVNWLL